MAERLALPTSDHGVAGSNPAGGEILPVPKWRFIAQSLSYSPFHRLEMTEILLKGRKTLTPPSIHIKARSCFRKYYSYIVSCYNDVIGLFEPHHDKTNKMTCAASEGSDQLGHLPSLISLLYPHEEALGPWLPSECTVKILIRLSGCRGWSESSLGGQAILLVLSCCSSFIVGFLV